MTTDAERQYASVRTDDGMREAEAIAVKVIDAVPEYAIADVMQLLDVARVRAFMRLYDIQRK